MTASGSEESDGRGQDPRETAPQAGGESEAARLARLYDWEHDPFEDDLELHLALARRFGGPVLELGCGTGRLLAPLAAAGFDCTGVDRDPAMLARAEARLREQGLLDRVRLFEQRIETLSNATGRFRTILWPLDGFALLLSRADQLAALRSVRSVATHDGRLVLDVSNGNLRGGHEPTEELLHHLTAPDPAHGRPITKWVVRRPQPDEQVDELWSLYDEQDAGGYVRRTTATLRLRWFTRFELELLLERAGWRVEEVYGSFDLAPFGVGSDRIVVVAARGAEPPLLPEGQPHADH